jgi:hypothetical protein
MNANRWSNIDRYLDEHVEAAPSKSAQILPISAPQPYGWCGRLNDRIERWMDRCDWRRFEMRVGTIFGYLLVLVVLYLIGVLVEAWATGAIDQAVR